MFCHFWQKFENSKWPPRKFYGGGGGGGGGATVLNPRYPRLSSGVELNFEKVTLSGTVKEIEGNLCFAIFGKNSKIQNGRHFRKGRGKFLK